ncbi:MAG: indole-3-glycerol phosphate synthase TrpC [Pseudomonadales bacterium]
MNEPTDILNRIVAEKWREIEARRTVLPLAELKALSSRAGSVRSFVGALRSRIAEKRPGVIAELKKASPSKGVIREQFDPAELARSYQAGGATCLSVLTDVNFFAGSDDNLSRAREASMLPVLRKDFIVDPYQVYEARAIGADCILLIVSILSASQMANLYQLASNLHMDVLVEVHDVDELEKALALSPAMIGINNRNLKTFEVDLNTSRDLAGLVPADTLIITESGIETQADVFTMQQYGVHGFLIGEAFMKAANPGDKLRQLFPD